MIETTPQGTLTLQQINGSDVVDYVHLAMKHSLHWETPQLTDWETFKVVAAASTLFGWEVIDALEPLFGITSGIVVAREHSGCLYVFVPMWVHQSVANMGNRGDERRPLTLSERMDITMQVTAVLSGADELDVLAHECLPQPDAVPALGEPVDIDLKAGFLPDNATPYRIRAWWD